MTTMDTNDAAIAAGDQPKQSLFARMRSRFSAWRAAARKRRALQDLSGLDPYMLRDIGLSWEDVHDGLLGRRRRVWLEPLPRDDGRFNP